MNTRKIRVGKSPILPSCADDTHGTLLSGEALTTRRDMLRRVGVLAGTGIAGGGVISLFSAQSFPAPVDAASAPPNLHIRLRAAEGKAEIVKGTRTAVWTYTAEVITGDPSSVVESGSYLGPTLRFRKGQRVRVSFENRLPQPSIVHWHGLNLPQRQDGQPADAVAGGNNYEYDFVINDEPGTYWYHPHPHMHTGEQVYRGLAGMIHVLGPEPVGMPSNELSLVLQDRSFNNDSSLRYTSSMHDTMAGFIGDTLVTNGVAGFTSTDRGRLELRSADLFIEGAGLSDLDARSEVAASFVARGAARSAKAPTRFATAPLPSANAAVNSTDPKQFVLSTRRMTHWINNDMWDERNVTSLERVKAGTVELWEFVNRSPVAHPMHVHGQSFHVVKRSWDGSGPAADWKRIESGIIETGRRDTVLVWPGQRVQIAVPFGMHKGFFLYHCHILEHEDMGMMRSFQVG